ncbi:MAG: hypothetical protein JXR73_09320 [Candidatus Omnitrophica bacterium]|nr:hypothetical protein [Candidatus Omnitrophota bacterium]
MKPRNEYDDKIKVQVTKRLPKKDIRSVVRQFIEQKLTFAVSRHDSEYEVWREVFPDDEPRIKNRKDGMTPAGVIAQDKKDLEQRNFVCIWDKGHIVYGKMDKV